MKLLINDTELKTLMKISEIDQADYSLLTSKHFLQTYVSDQILTEPICVLLLRSAPKEYTNNPNVMFNNIIIETYVHGTIDTTNIGGFKRRIHLINDRIVKLLHNKYIGSNLYKFVDGNELQSSTPAFRRYYVMFQYKAIYA